jgi:hypothetical protein
MKSRVRGTALTPVSAVHCPSVQGPGQIARHLLSVVVGGAGDVFAHCGRESSEPALRLIRAVRELNEERGFGIRVIAFHTEAERQALFVRAADDAMRLREVDSTGSSTRCSQFSSTRLLSALDALAVHPYAAIKVAELN